MIISFFEEFPTPNNLSKIKLIFGKKKLYLAAKSVAEFLSWKKKLSNVECVYWPLLDRKEGYWISPFSERKALERIFSELEEQKISVMLDLELPTSQNPKLYFNQLFNFWVNKNIIKKFIQNYPGEVYLAEYYPEGRIKEWGLRLLGLHYSSPNYGIKVKVMKMLYHSLHHFSDKFLEDKLLLGKKEWGDNFVAAFGTIAVGVHGVEPRLHLETLKNDLKIAKKCGVKEVVIFRLGGINNRFCEYYPSKTSLTINGIILLGLILVVQ